VRSWWSRKGSVEFLERVVAFFRAFLLVELVKGLMLTGRNLFARKVAVRYPEERTPRGPR
jgi:NADH-quinone oxidoreductase subunit I